MLSFLPRRLLQLLPTLFLVSVLIFLLQQLLPGDPALVMAGEEKDPAVIEQIRQQYRLDQPLPVQYAYWRALLHREVGDGRQRLHVLRRDWPGQPHKRAVQLDLLLLSLLEASLVLLGRHPQQAHFHL